ncbi:MAG: flagellar filament capping protein FliD [Azoarcus sp.]|jgi:flagellar hook-associated protein 2|nr:flagellar filament capping protein FliD [Azoarcus sp.]
MATITSLGVGSGLDLEGLVSSLMKIEQIPLDSLKSKVTSFNTKISAMGTLASKLSALQTAAKGLKPDTLQSAMNKFGTYTGSISNDSVASVTVGEGALGSSFKLEVSQLAQGQKSKLDSSAFSGSGSIDFNFGDASKNFSITPASNDLTAIANAINQADKGITATVVNGSNGKELVLTGQEGAANAFTVGGAGVSGASTTIQTAQNAELKIDGISVTSSSNTVKDAVTGVTLQLKSTTSAGSPATVTVSADYSDKLKKGLEAFVKAFNDVVSSVNSLGAYNAETKTAGALNGNSVLRDAQNTLRNLVFDNSSGLKDENGNTMMLSSLGITFQKDGTLTLDSDKLDAAIKKNPNLAANFAAEIGNRFNTGLDKLVGTGGKVDTLTEGMRSNVRTLEKQQEAMQTRLEATEARYRKQFSALDTLLASMNSTSSYLTQQLASLSTSK